MNVITAILISIYSIVTSEQKELKVFNTCNELRNLRQGNFLSFQVFNLIMSGDKVKKLMNINQWIEFRAEENII